VVGLNACDVHDVLTTDTYALIFGITTLQYLSNAILQDGLTILDRAEAQLDFFVYTEGRGALFWFENFSLENSKKSIGGGNQWQREKPSSDVFGQEHNYEGLNIE
jgi:hypothetical protein